VLPQMAKSGIGIPKQIGIHRIEIIGGEVHRA
jgi:hypothetical protein